MLENAGVPFEPVDAPCDEDAEKIRLREHSIGGRELAEALAMVKASAARAGPDDLVLGADQTLECDDGRMLDKAESRADALEQLRSLSGRSHQLHSAAAICEAGTTVWQATESVRLDMRPLSEDFLESYLDVEYAGVRSNVGCYRIEGRGLQLFDRIVGSQFAIMGLPMMALLHYLRERGIIPQ